jgi:hypothetical protein
MRGMVSVVALSVVASLSAQSLSDTIVERERAKMHAERTAQGLSAFYLPTYAGVGQRGQPQTAMPGTTFQTLADPKFVLEEPLTVYVYQSAALVTGVQAPGGARRARFVRVWVRDGGDWKIAIHQGTAIGERQANATPVTSVPTPIPPPASLSDDEAAVLRIQEALWIAYAQHDARTYDRLTAPEFVSVTALGQVIPRDEWLKNNVAKSQDTRPPSVKDDVKIRIFDDMAVMTCRSLAMQQGGTATSSDRLITIFAKKNGSWQQVHTQSTTILQGANTIN